MAEEESQNQSNPITPKRIKIKHSIEEEDRISLLPDCLLIDIISRLDSTKEAIKTGTLSKRWQHLWPYVHNLIFQFYENLWDSETNASTRCTYQRLSEYVSFVGETLAQCRCLNLNKFQLLFPYDISIESQVNFWVCYAVNRNVQHLDLSISYNDELVDESEFLLDDFFFIGSSLKLRGCVFDPTFDISWSRLKSLSISKGILDEDVIQNIFSGSPLLETLELCECYGYRRLDITSKSVKRLVFSGYYGNEVYTDIVVINAPYLLSLTIQYELDMWKLLLLDVSSLVEAKLDYWKGGHYEATPGEEREEMFNFKDFILKLRNVKELTIGNRCEKVFTLLKAEGFTFPSNIKYLHWCGPSEDGEDEDEYEEDDSD